MGQHLLQLNNASFTLRAGLFIPRPLKVLRYTKGQEYQAHWE